MRDSVRGQGSSRIKMCSRFSHFRDEVFGVGLLGERPCRGRSLRGDRGEEIVAAVGGDKVGLVMRLTLWT